MVTVSPLLGEYFQFDCWANQYYGGKWFWTFWGQGPDSKNLIKVWVFLSRKMHICTQMCIHFQGLLSIQKACLKNPAYEPLFQSNWMQGTTWALPYVAKKSLPAPNTEGQPLPYLAFCLPLELQRPNGIGHVTQKCVKRVSERLGGFFKADTKVKSPRLQTFTLIF